MNTSKKKEQTSECLGGGSLGPGLPVEVEEEGLAEAAVRRRVQVGRRVDGRQWDGDSATCEGRGAGMTLAADGGVVAGRWWWLLLSL